MNISRRALFKTASTAAGGIAATAVLGNLPTPREAFAQDACAPLPPAFNALKPLGDRVKPIRKEEFQARIARAQELMSEAHPRFDALYVTPETTLVYFKIGRAHV